MAELSGSTVDLLRSLLSYHLSSGVCGNHPAAPHHLLPASGGGTHPNRLSLVQISFLALPRRLLSHLFIVFDPGRSHLARVRPRALHPTSTPQSLDPCRHDSAFAGNPVSPVRRTANTYQARPETRRHNSFALV